MDGKEKSMTKMGKTVKASLIYCGRNIDWLAERLGVSRSYIYDRLHDDRWEIPQARVMQKLFKWQSLEG